MDSDELQPEPTTLEPEVVWLFGRNRYAFLVHRGAYYSTVRWDEESILYEEEIENNDYEFWSERAIEFESDPD